MGLILNTVAATLTEDEWDFDPDEEHDVIRTGVTAKNASFRMVFDAREEGQQLLLYILCANQISEDKRGEIAEFTTRANYGWYSGTLSWT